MFKQNKKYFTVLQQLYTIFHLLRTKYPNQPTHSFFLCLKELERVLALLKNMLKLFNQSFDTKKYMNYKYEFINNNNFIIIPYLLDLKENLIEQKLSFTHFKQINTQLRYIYKYLIKENYEAEPFLLLKKKDISTYSYIRNYNIQKLINLIMKHGKKVTSENIVMQILFLLKLKYKIPAVGLIAYILNYIRPTVSITNMVFHGKIFNIPTSIPSLTKQFNYALRLILRCAHSKSNKNIANKIYDEFVDIINNNAETLNKKFDLSQMLAKNQAYLSYRWRMKPKRKRMALARQKLINKKMFLKL